MNTIIITEENGGINSKDYWGYALKPSIVPNPGDETETLHRLTLIACRDKHVQQNVDISIFFSDDPADTSQQACNALESLIDAIKTGERIWDIRDHNPNL